MALFGAFSYSELASSLPRSGGEYHLLSQSVHPALGFSSGLVSATVGFSAPAVLAAMALGKYLSVVMPFFDPTWTAAIVIIGFHVIHSFSKKVGKFIQNSTTGIKIGLIISFIIMGMLVPNPQQISILPKSGDGALFFNSGFAVSLVWVSFAYTGWNSTAYIAGEIIDPKKNISRSLLISTGFVIILYVLLNYVFLLSTPIHSMVGELEVGYISGVNIYGTMGAKIVSFGIAVLLISTVSSYIFIGPRIMQVIGEDYSTLHFLSKRNKNGIPINAFLIQFIISMLFILSSSFEQVLLYTSIALIITTTATVFGVYILRKREPDLNRPYHTWGYPFTPGIFILLNIWIIYYTLMAKPIESFVGLAIVGLGIIIYFFNKRIGKREANAPENQTT